jgi:hypothetical protein
MSGFRQEIAQLIDEAGKVIEECQQNTSAQQQIIKRHLPDVIYKTRDNAPPVAPPAEPEMDAATAAAWNNWMRQALESFMETVVIPVVAQAMSEEREELTREFETKLNALRTDMRAARWFG